MPGLGKGHFNGSATDCLRLLLPVWFNRCCRCEIGMCGVSFRCCSFEELVNRHHKKDIARFRKRDVADRIGYRVRTLNNIDMIKRIVQYFEKRREMRLRKWCAKLAVKTYDVRYEYMYDAANKIYEWIKGLPESKS